MKPKEFIEIVFINEIGEIHSKHPYIAFALMAVGIEFLGKCLNEFDSWDVGGRSKEDIQLAINTLSAFEKYRPYLDSHKFATNLRNGMLHMFVPKAGLTLSSKSQAPNLLEYNGTLNLRCEDFYIDFKSACEEVIAMDINSFKSKKMNLELLSVPTE